MKWLLLPFVFLFLLFKMLFSKNQKSDQDKMNFGEKVFAVKTTSSNKEFIQ